MYTLRYLEEILGLSADSAGAEVMGSGVSRQRLGWVEDGRQIGQYATCIRSNVIKTKANVCAEIACKSHAIPAT